MPRVANMTHGADRRSDQAANMRVEISQPEKRRAAWRGRRRFWGGRFGLPKILCQPFREAPSSSGCIVFLEVGLHGPGEQKKAAPKDGLFICHTINF